MALKLSKHEWEHAEGIGTLREQLASSHARIAELEAALRETRLTAAVLLQNAEGCAVNHYGEDFQLHGEPGWLRDCRVTIERATKLINS